MPTPTLVLPPGPTHLFGRPDAPESAAVRDFLNRSNVAFEWVALADDAACQRYLNAPRLDGLPLPVLELGNGRRLAATSPEEVAQQLGWLQKPRLKQYDLAIYGAGPAGLSAAVYGASEGLRTVLLEPSAVGGQAGTSSLIENYLGFPAGVAGAELAARAREQACKFGVEILLLRGGVSATFGARGDLATLSDGSHLRSLTSICATGVQYRSLGLAGEAALLNKGVYYGAGVSEAPMCQGKEVFVIGGGNSAGQAALNLARFARRVTLVVRGPSLAATLSQYLLTRVQTTRNVRLLLQAEVTALAGHGHLAGLTITNRRTRRAHHHATQHLFVCIGGAPHTAWTEKTNICCDSAGYVLTGSDILVEGKAPASWPLARLPFPLETGVPGVFAAGDVRHGSVKRVASAVGEGAMAVTFVHQYVEELANRTPRRVNKKRAPARKPA